jgi:hypothetical protein
MLTENKEYKQHFKKHIMDKCGNLSGFNLSVNSMTPGDSCHQATTSLQEMEGKPS